MVCQTTRHCWCLPQWSVNFSRCSPDQRIGTRRGKKRAAAALGHTILVMVYHMLTQSKEYEELGGNYFDERDRNEGGDSSIESRIWVTKFRCLQGVQQPKYHLES